MALGLAIRFYQIERFAGFDFDQEAAAWWIKSFLVDHKISLIGQQISLGGIFTGPGYYYLLSVFYFLGGMNPLAGNVLQMFFALGSMVLIYRLGGIWALFIYIFSFRIILVDRGSAPSNPLIFLALLAWEFRQNIPVSFLLSGVSWNFHPTGMLMLPVSLAEGLGHKFKASRSSVYLGLAGFILLILPSLLFELRHGFGEVQRFGEIFTAGAQPGAAYPFIFKMLLLARINIQNFLAIFGLPGAWQGIIMIAAVIWLARQHIREYLIWIAVPLLVFSFYPGPVPEYYFLLTFPAIILIYATLARRLAGSGVGRALLPIAAAVFFYLNLRSFMVAANPYSLLSKERAVNYVLANCQCPQVTYGVMAAPGLNNGFPYLFWLRDPQAQSGAVNSRYTLFLPGDLSSESGATFGDIKVVKNF